MKSKTQVLQVPPPLRSLFTVRQLSERYPFSEAALRALILNSRDRLNSSGEKIAGNGLEKAIVRCGRKLLIDESLFLEFLAEQSQRAMRAQR